jgi:hypothetical protein
VRLKQAERCRDSPTNATRACRSEPRRPAASCSRQRHDPLAGSGPDRRLAVRSDPLVFVTAQRTQTLPVALYNYVREYADPSMAAVSVMYIVATSVLLILANTFLGLARVLNVERPR